jgi:hypothetical protein
MAIRFGNGFGVGASNNGGGGGGGPITNCSPTSTFGSNVYYDSGTTLTWSDDTSGYTLYNGGFTAVDEGYSNNPIILPSNFFMTCTGSTKLYLSTNGYVSFEVGTSGNGFSGPQNATPPMIAANPGDMYLNPGLSINDGTTSNAWYKITNNGNFMKVELKVFQTHFQNQAAPMSYQLNLYKDSTYQWIETFAKSGLNQDAYGGQYIVPCGPTSSTDVSQPTSTTSKVWRGELGGSTWEYMGEGSVSITAPLSQYTPNGTNGPYGLLLNLDGNVATSGTTILDQTSYHNDFTWSGNNPYNSTYYALTGGTIATSNTTTYFTSMANSIAMTMWIKLTSITGGVGIVSKTPGANRGWALRYLGGQFNLVKYNVADQYSNGTYALSPNTWYHIAVMQGGTSLTYMVNGQIFSASNTADNTGFDNTTDPVRIGYDPYSGFGANMEVGMFRIYDAPLAASSVLTEFNNTKATYGY